MNVNFIPILLKMSNYFGKKGLFVADVAKKKSKDFVIATVTESFYLAMYLTFVAFILGLSSSLQWRYKDKFVSGFIKMSLPALGEPSQEIAWETFQHLISKEVTLPDQNNSFTKPLHPVSILFASPTVKRVDIYNDSLLLELKTPWDKLKAQKYIGFYRAKAVDSGWGSGVNHTNVTLYPEGEYPLNSVEEANKDLNEITRVTQLVEANSLTLHPSKKKNDLAVAAINNGEMRSQQSQRTRKEEEKSINWQKRIESSLTAGGIQKRLLPRERASSRWLRIASRDLVPMQENPFVLSLRERQSLSRALFEGTSAMLLTKYPVNENLSLHINPLSSGERHLNEFPQSFRSPQSLLYRVGSKTAELTTTKANINKIQNKHMPNLVYRHAGSNWSSVWANQLDELPYKLSNNQVSTSAFLAIEDGQCFTRLQTKDLVLRAQQDRLKNPEKALENEALKRNKGSSIVAPSIPEDRNKTLREQVKPLSMMEASLKPKSNCEQTKAILIGAIEERRKSESLLQAQDLGSASLLPFFEKAPNFNGTSANDFEKEQKLCFASDKSVNRKMLVKKQGLLKKEISSGILSDATYQRNWWEWKSLDDLLEDLENSETAFLLMSVDMAPSNELVAKQVTENSVDQDDDSITTPNQGGDEGSWEDLFNVLNTSGLNLLQSIRQIPPRLISGYHFPDSSVKQISKLLFRLLARNKFKLQQITAKALVGEIEVRLPHSPSCKMFSQLAQTQPGLARPGELNSLPIVPVVEIGYQYISFNDLQPLQSILSELQIEMGDGEVDDIGTLRSAYQGPAIAQDMATNDIVVNNKEQIAEWITKRIQGSAGSVFASSHRPGVVFEQQVLSEEGLLPDRQGSLLGKKEVLRGEVLTQQELYAALRSRPITSISETFSTKQSAGIKPIKSNGLSLERLLSGSYLRLKDPFQVVWSDKGEETPAYPLEVVLAKSLPILEEEQEILALEPKEWDTIFKTVLVDAINTNSGLEKVEVLLPSIAVAAQSVGMPFSSRIGPVIHDKSPRGPLMTFQPLTKEGAADRSHRALFENELFVSKSEERPSVTPVPFDNYLGLSLSLTGDSDPNFFGNNTDGRASILHKPLTFQDYRSLTGLLAPSNQFIGEPAYYMPGDFTKDAGEGNPPLLLCHYLPMTQSPVVESSSKRAFAAGIYQKRLTSFVSQRQIDRAARNSKRLTVNPMILKGGLLFPGSPGVKSISKSSKASMRQDCIGPQGERNSLLLPKGPSRTRSFHQTWEPVTLNSWMMLYKLCFAFWVREMGRDFYQRYGKEIILYALNLLVALGFNAQGIIEDLGLEDSPMRVITNGQKRFHDVAGIDSVLPELGEIVWFLRSSGRGGQIPKGILLVGPPGTGKTFVVQAIAGESKVPVIVQSASALIDSAQKQSGSQRLRDLFDKARELAPCILFMDEIDTLGLSRPNVIGNTMGTDELLESIEGTNGRDQPAGLANLSGQLEDAPLALSPYSHFLPTPRASRESLLDSGDDSRPTDEKSVFEVGGGNAVDSSALDPSVVKVIESHNEERRSKQERLALLMQFLMEMDGLRSLHGVVVIGATNRPGVLDPAFIRPGRFERVLCLQLPGKQKRIEIFKLYSKDLGMEGSISWEYLANRTAGLSAAHLAAAMNQSAIRAIIDNTTHTIETIEHGISVIARRSFQGSSIVANPAMSVDLPANPIEAITALLSPGFHLHLTSTQDSKSTTTRPTKDIQPIPGKQSDSCLEDSTNSPVEEKGFKLSDNLKMGHTWSGKSEPRQTGPYSATILARLAYYQAGKAVLETILPLHPPAAFLPLFPHPFNRATSDLGKIVTSNYQQGFLEPYCRNVLETRLIGLYAGKAGELLALSKAPSLVRGSTTASSYRSDSLPTSVTQLHTGSALPRESKGKAPDTLSKKAGELLAQSDLGAEELTFAGTIANNMVDSWYLYAKKIAIQKSTLADITQDLAEIEDPVLFDLFKHAADERDYEVKRRTFPSQRFQQWSPPAWWQTQALVEAELVEPGYSEWYRLYIADPEETERNIDWIPPEDHYHTAGANRLKNLSRKRENRAEGLSRSHNIRPRHTRHHQAESGHRASFSKDQEVAITWNDLYLVNRDYIYHGLINACFHKAFSLLERKRELLDCFGDHLLRYDSIRQYEIDTIAENFGITLKHQGESITSDSNKMRNVKVTPVDKGTDKSDSSVYTPLTASAATISTNQSGDIANPWSNDSVLSQKPPVPTVEPDWTIPPLVQQNVIKSSQFSPGGALPGRVPPPNWVTSHVAETRWGAWSRRKAAHFVDFDFVKPCFLRDIPTSTKS